MAGSRPAAGCRKRRRPSRSPGHCTTRRAITQCCRLLAGSDCQRSRSHPRGSRSSAGSRMCQSRTHRQPRTRWSSHTRRRTESGCCSELLACQPSSRPSQGSRRGARFRPKWSRSCRRQRRRYSTCTRRHSARSSSRQWTGRLGWTGWKPSRCCLPGSLRGGCRCR